VFIFYVMKTGLTEAVFTFDALILTGSQAPRRPGGQEARRPGGQEAAAF
jgi:hypothetical protein